MRPPPTLEAADDDSPEHGDQEHDAPVGEHPDQVRVRDREQCPANRAQAQHLGSAHFVAEVAADDQGQAVTPEKWRQNRALKGWK